MPFREKAQNNIMEISEVSAIAGKICIIEKQRWKWNFGNKEGQ